MYRLHLSQLLVLLLRNQKRIRAKTRDKAKGFPSELNIKVRYKMMKENVEKVLDEIRPHLQADGGDVELVSIEGGVVKVKFLGGCIGCPFAAMTLQNGIERYLKEKLPEVKEVISI